MTKFYEIFRRADPARVLDIFSTSHPSCVKHIARYESMIKELETTEPKSSDYKIDISRLDAPGFALYQVKGKNLSNGEGIALSCFTSAEWLGMAVSDETICNYTPEEIVAHCLYDMTLFEDLDWEKKE